MNTRTILRGAYAAAADKFRRRRRLGGLRAREKATDLALETFVTLFDANAGRPPTWRKVDWFLRLMDRLP